MRAERFDFPNVEGQLLTAVLQHPSGEPRDYALFAHCFTCGKDIHAASRIANALTDVGFGVLRFDFTGLGQSEGDFADSTFGGNVQDLHAAARAMVAAGREPSEGVLDRQFVEGVRVVVVEPGDCGFMFLVVWISPGFARPRII